MPRKGRDFELLIEKIKKVLLPIDSIIKSPDFLPDLVSGNKKREVDISIRTIINSSPILITVECRDRNVSNEDTTWIEQLVTKANDLGIHKTIAVSSKGFSEQAIIKANHYGIGIRVLKEITDKDILDWLDIKEISKIDNQFELVQVNFNEKLVQEFKQDNILDQILANLKNNKKVFWVSHNRTYCGINEIFIGLTSNQDIYKELEFGAEKIEKKFNAHLTDFYISIKLGKSEYKLTYIEFVVKIWKTIIKIPISKIYDYRNENEALLKRAEFNIPINKTTKTLSINKKSTGETHINIE